MRNTTRRLKFRVVLDVDSSLTNEQVYKIIDSHLDELTAKGAGVEMYRYDLPRRQELITNEG